MITHQGITGEIVRAREAVARPRDGGATHEVGRRPSRHHWAAVGAPSTTPSSSFTAKELSSCASSRKGPRVFATIRVSESSTAWGG